MTAQLWTSEEAAKATGGEAKGDWTISGLSIDTRSLEWGDLFVPIKDARDGHDFIPNARAGGAAAVISENPNEQAPALIVKDSVQAMRDLGVAARKRSKAKRIAVTGSVGKTSLKEAIAVICGSVGRTHKSIKSFNNHWGVPLTLARMPKDTEYGVFEVGMNHAGELADLSPLIAPQIAVITKIAPAHLAHFKNVGAIAEAKAEIFEGLAVGGAAILNRDDDYFDFLAKAASKKDAAIISFGAHKDASVRIEGAKSEAGRQSADLVIDGESYALSLPLDGAHWIENAACAVAACLAAGINPEKSVAALRGFRALPGRGEAIDVKIDGKLFTLIDDSYNANPESMKAAIETLSSRASGRKIAVLGDMFELGKDELDLHAALSVPLIEADVSRVIFTGECMRALKGALPRQMRGAWVRNWEGAYEALRHELSDGDTVLIKGSNATGLSQLVAAIRKEQKGVADVL
ncbi:MAG: UDP-N-acetylmuramoyl-tripeptide--D-alanyl-D-alanine ligase [Hellea sp.]|nr:UDP-N-acetylmuramoyl-tripeptide--D-alanyl-D-alanine ligase [Hellea sp.]